MNIDPFASSAFSLILAWIFAIPILLGIIIIPFEVFGKEFKGDRILFIWFGICLLVLSPIRYLLFQGILLSSYIFQSWGAFISIFLLALYVPAVFCILGSIGVGLPFLTVSFILGVGKTYHISFNKSIISAIVFPIICLISTYIFCLILPYAVWTVHWVNPKDVIKATNGPAAIVYKYVTSPFSFSPTMVNGIFDRTPKRDIDSLRCHVATTYIKNQKFWYFVKLQYPAIFQQIMVEDKKKVEEYCLNGVAKFESKNYLGAIQDYNKAIDLNPKYVEGYIVRGMAKFKSKDYLGAIQDFNKAIELNPKHAFVYFARGEAKRYLKDYLGAIQDFNKAIELNPKYAFVYFARGLIKIVLKDKYGGCLDFSKAGELGYKKAYDAIQKYCK